MYGQFRSEISLILSGGRYDINYDYYSALPPEVDAFLQLPPVPHPDPVLDAPGSDDQSDVTVTDLSQ